MEPKLVAGTRVIYRPYAPPALRDRPPELPGIYQGMTAGGLLRVQLDGPRQVITKPANVRPAP